MGATWDEKFNNFRDAHQESKELEDKYYVEIQHILKGDPGAVERIKPIVKLMAESRMRANDAAKALGYWG